MFSVFHAYDDEGYFLVTLRDYIHGHADYNQIYGPFFYEVMGAVFRIPGLDVTTDSGRVVTLVLWLLTSLVGGIAVLTLTRDLWLGVAGQFLTFHALSALTSEPMHPSGLISFLLVGLVAIAAGKSRTPRTWALLVGALIAAITLVKINVGAYAALAVAFAFAAALSGRWRQVALAATSVALVAGPLLLMSGLFQLEWVVELAFLVALSAAAVALAGFAVRSPAVPPIDAVWLIVGGAAVTIACLGLAAAGGLRLSDLVDSVVGAARLPQLFVLPAPVGIPDVVWAALSVAATGAILWLRFGARASPPIPACLRIAAGAFTWLSVLVLPSPFFLLALPLVWVAVLPPAGDHENPTDPFVRLLLAALAVMETLQAYPVAGTQMWLATLALVPVGAITFNDGIRQLRLWAAGRENQSFLKVAAAVGPGALILNVAVWPLFVYLAASGYASGQPLGLPGAGLMRLPPEQASALQSLAAAIDKDCTNLITLPRMPSLYLWTGKEGVAQLNDGIWMFSLDAAQQQSVVSQVRDKTGTCIVISQAVADFEAEGRPIPRRPLIEYIDTAFEPAGTFGIYELLVRKPQ
ncbi:MAG TPA: hypothetical protein VGS16_12810 [Candidatus Dormibacteraeota bacterium]|nr:hypothetical protein [Candidatus Dormibacteraeota bacterium]